MRPNKFNLLYMYIGRHNYERLRICFRQKYLIKTRLLVTSFWKKIENNFLSPPGGAREFKLRPFDSESKTTSGCSNSLISKKIAPHSLFSVRFLYFSTFNIRSTDLKSISLIWYDIRVITSEFYMDCRKSFPKILCPNWLSLASWNYDFSWFWKSLHFHLYEDTLYSGLMIIKFMIFLWTATF